MRIRSLSFTSFSTSSDPSPELASARSDLESSLSSLAEDLTDLVESVKAIEKDPYKYGLELDEVARRKRLVEEVGGEIEDMQEELLKLVGRGPAQGSWRGATPDIADGERHDEGAHDAYGEFEQQQQLRIMHEQDQQLDGVFRTVGNLRQQANDMGRELEEQQEMLEHVDSVADRVGGRLQSGVQKLGEVMRKNEDKWSGCCISVLILVLIILLILVIAL